MLKISHAACLGPSVVNLAQFTLEMHLAAQNRQKIHKNPYFNVQGHCCRWQSKARVRLPIID